MGDQVTGSDEVTDVPLETVRVFVHGRVQGVWFRGWTVETALALGLSGWVRNRRDGTVEALFHGPAERVREMVMRCRIGPATARVSDIEQFAASAKPVAGFVQLPTV